VSRFLVRTGLLVLSLALLFPEALSRPTHGAWPRMVLGLGVGRWVLWGVAFVTLGITRLSGGPKRGA